MDIEYPNLTDGEWQTWGRNATTMIPPETSPAMGISLELATSLESAFNAYDAAYMLAVDPATRSTPRVQGKNTALTGLKAAAKPVVAILQSNPDVSDEQRVELGLKVRDRVPTPAAVPTSAPSVVAMLTGPQSARVIARNPLTPDSRAKPAGVGSVVVQAVQTTGGALPPADLSTWPIAQRSGRTTIDLYWPAMTGETTVWTSCYWVNTRQQRGPSSTPVSVRLPGSGVAGAEEVAA